MNLKKTKETVQLYLGGGEGRGRGGIMVSVGSSYSSDLKVSGLRFSPCHCVVSLDKKLYPHCLALPKMGTGAILLGVPLRWNSIPSRGE